MVVRRSFVITNRHGLHARATTAFVLTAARFAAEIEVEMDGRRADGKTFIDMLLLVATEGSTVTVCARGVDAEEAVQALGGVIAGIAEPAFASMLAPAPGAD
jgi:phosphocarrier protein